MEGAVQTEVPEYDHCDRKQVGDQIMKVKAANEKIEQGDIEGEADEADGVEPHQPLEPVVPARLQARDVPECPAVIPQEIVDDGELGREDLAPVQAPAEELRIMEQVEDHHVDDETAQSH